MPYTPIWISWPVKQASQLGNCRILNKISLSKKTSKTMEEGGPSFGKHFSETCRHVIAFLKSDKGHMGSSLTTTPLWGPRGRCGGYGGGVWRWMEEIWVEGRVRESWRHLFFLFSPATCLFWVFPSNLPYKGKNEQIEKRDQMWKTWPHFNTSCVWPQGRCT